MEINTNKCEFITSNIGEKIINIKTNEVVPSVEQAKYLGQILNERGTPISIITQPSGFVKRFYRQPSTFSAISGIPAPEKIRNGEFAKKA